MKGYLRLNDRLIRLEKKVHALLQILVTPVQLGRNERLVLRQLPGHMIKTYFALEEFGEASASDVASVTGKVRAVESGYLCQLVTMGFCLKRRKGRKVLFSCKFEGGDKTEHVLRRALPQNEGAQ